MSDAARAAALQSAVRFHGYVGDLDLRCGVDAGHTIAAGQISVLDTAEVFLAWLRGPAHLALTAGPVVDQTSGLPTGTPISEGVPVQIHDNEQFDVTVTAEDAKGFATADAVTFVSSDETVFTVVAGADPMTSTVVAGVPGSAVLTVSDGTLSATLAVDVVPAGAATIALSEGPVTVQP